MRNDEVIKKWGEILEHDAFDAIQDKHRLAVTATLLENTETALKEGSSYSPAALLSEAEVGPVNNASHVQNYDPVLISLVRRAMPNLIAYDIAGVQPMTGPTGLIFAMRSNYVDGTNNEVLNEAFYNEADTDFSGTGTHLGALGTTQDVTNTSVFETGTAMTTNAAEELGSTNGGDYAEMSFQIDKVSVTAGSRALKAEYTTEMAQDLKAIHGLDAETELANMLSASLLQDINREVVRTVYGSAVQGSATDTAVAGVFNLDVDANGRWSVEKFKGLMFQIEKEANAIAKQTRRGKGNIILCSSDVASALQMAGVLDHTPALNANNLNVDDTGNTFVGVLNGRFRVYVDPFAGANYMVVGYKGAGAFDAGLFYCPYVPLQMVRAVGENSFQSKIGFKTRYGMVANPFSPGATAGNGALTYNTNVYYRRTIVNNLL